MSGKPGAPGRISQHSFKRHELLSLLITFGVGVMAGLYLYLTGFAPQFEDLSGQTESVYTDLVIVGERYGGGRGATAPSFQVLNDGTFRHLEIPVEGGDAVVKEGTVPRALMADLRNEITIKDLERAMQPDSTDNCASYVDKFDYRYTITYDAVSYDLNSCGTEFAVSSALGASLDSLWNYFENLPVNYPLN